MHTGAIVVGGVLLFAMVNRYVRNYDLFDARIALESMVSSIVCLAAASLLFFLAAITPGVFFRVCYSVLGVISLFFFLWIPFKGTAWVYRSRKQTAPARADS